MDDPRLNSLHLDTGRREHYWQAREVLLASRGNETCYVEKKRQEDSSVDNTFIRNKPGSPPTSHEFWLLDREYVYPLQVGLNTMGRSGDNNVVVEDLFVSRRHAAIVIHHDKSFVLHDTASKNGTYLNGSRISGPTPLNAGDEIRICNRQFVFFTRTAPPIASLVSPTKTIAV